MNPHNDPRGMMIRMWIISAVSMVFIAGCTSAKMETQTSANIASSEPSIAQEPAPQPPDESWPTESYLQIGLPDPGRFWTAEDYRDCRDVLYTLVRTNRPALPRMESSKSGAVFARLINTTNTLLLTERFLPTKERIHIFLALINRFPAFRDIYRFDLRTPAFHREVIELNHTFLSMLRSAVKWDGLALPPAPGETQPATFHLTEASRTYREGLLNLKPERSVVPRGERFIVVGGYTSEMVASMLPWLADGTGLSVEDRLRAVRYLREDMPILWPHVSSSNQSELAGQLGQVLRRTSHEDIHRNLEALRQLMHPAGG